jgi:hypothetical protein
VEVGVLLEAVPRSVGDGEGVLVLAYLSRCCGDWGGVVALPNLGGREQEGWQGVQEVWATGGKSPGLRRCRRHGRRLGMRQRVVGIRFSE